MKFSIVLSRVDAEPVESADDSWIWPPESVTVIAEFAEAMADTTPEDAVEPRAMFSSPVITCCARLSSRALVYVTLLACPGVVFNTA